MKNVISKHDDNQIREFVNQKENKFGFDQNQYTTVEQKQDIKVPSKLIKGKIKVYNSKKRPKLIDREKLDDETELNLISERMFFFVKFTFLFLIIITFLLFLKKNT